MEVFFSNPHYLNRIIPAEGGRFFAAEGYGIGHAPIS